MLTQIRAICSTQTSWIVMMSSESGQMICSSSFLRKFSVELISEADMVNLSNLYSDWGFVAKIAWVLVWKELSFGSECCASFSFTSLLSMPRVLATRHPTSVVCVRAQEICVAGTNSVQ